MLTKKNLFSTLILMLLLSWIGETARAQSVVGDAGGGVILSDQLGQYSLGLQMEILEDPSGQLTIDQVTSPEFDPYFTPSNEETLRFGVTRSAIWTRFRIDDLSQTIPAWLLEVRNSTLEYVDLYLPQLDGSYQRHPSGLLVPDADQEYPDNHYVFEIPAGLQPDQTVYLRFATTNSMTIPATLWSPSAFDQMERNEELLWGAYFGILLVMAIYNGLLFLSLRDRNYLFLMLYILTVLIQTAFMDGRVKDLLPADLGYQYRYLFPLFAIPNLPALLLFSTSFLNIKEFAPHLYKVVLWLFGLLGLLIVLTFMVNRYLVTVIFLLVTLPVIAVVFLSGVAAWRKGYLPARYFLLGMLVPLLFGFGDALGRLGMLPVIPYLYSGAHLGNAILITILSLALADRINYYQRQTEETAEKLRQSEALITEYLDALPVGVAVYGQDKKTRLINQTALEIFHLDNYNPDGGLDRLTQDLTPYISGSDIPYPIEDLPAYQALTGRPGRLEDIEFDIQGKRVSLEIIAKPIYDAIGAVQYAISVYQDITQRKLVEEELANYRENLEELVVARTRQEQRQRAIAESLQLSASVLNSDLNVDNVLLKILEQLPQVIELDSAAIYLKTGEDLVLSNATNNSQYENGLKIPLSSDRNPAVKVFREGKSRFFSDLEVDPYRNEWENAFRVRSWMGTPLQSGDEVFGVLSVSSATPALYDNANLPVLEAFANHASIAMINAHLYEESRNAAALEERNRLARDLHDSVTQTLFSASLIAEALPLQWEQDQTGARENLVRLHQLTSGALAEMRMLLLELRPGSIEKYPLSMLMSNLCEAFQSKNNIPIDLNITEEDSFDSPTEVKEFFYRITQESLNNIAKHSQANHVKVHLEQTEEGILLRILDNGKGFNPNQIDPGHLGLQIMRERAATIHAIIQIESQPGMDTTISSEWKRSP